MAAINMLSVNNALLNKAAMAVGSPLCADLCLHYVLDL
jgi:hypothetical protein